MRMECDSVFPSKRADTLLGPARGVQAINIAWIAQIARHAHACAIFVALLLGVGPSVAAEPALRVTTFNLAPFVMEDKGALTGFSIELWNAVARKIGTPFEYQAAPDVNSLLNALRAGHADAAVSGLFYTSERDREFDFSYPILEVGLRVMVLDTGQGSAPNPVVNLMDLLFSRMSLIWVAIALTLIVVAAHLLWLIERGKSGETELGGAYFPGIFRAMYWSATALLTQADRAPRRWLARLLAVAWMFFGIVFVAFYTAQLTTTLTVQRIRGTINGPDDLAGKQVATLKGGSAIPYLREHNAFVQEYEQVEQVYQALLEKRADAVLLGSAGLNYYADHEGKGLVRVVGPEFNRNDVGFVFRLGSPLRKRVDGALLALREDGTYQRIYDKWFGTQ